MESGQAGPSFSRPTAAVFIFNLIVGTGALALPAALAQAGWLLGSGLLVVLGITSYLTATWVVEAMAACNGILSCDQSINNHQLDKEEEEEPEPNFFEAPDETDDQAYLVRSDLAGQIGLASYGSVTASFGNSTPCRLARRLELAEMAELLFSRAGRLAFSLCMAAYLYGDLAIYCTAVAKSIRDVTCPVESNATSATWDRACRPGWSLSRATAYRLYVVLFVLLLGPFAFFSVSKTKYLQLATTVLRWAAFLLMVGLAAARLADPQQQHGSPGLANIATAPQVLGTSVYAFMCHHSLPGLVTPVRDPAGIPGILAVDYTMIAAFYLILANTGIFAFPKVPDLYTLAFAPPAGTNPGLATLLADYFLALFPVFTLSTNFPIIAITLRSNLSALSSAWPSKPIARRILFPCLAVLPPALVALATDDLGILVTVTGAYAGAGIQYIIPVCLVYLARKRLGTLEAGLGQELPNPLQSPATGPVWLLVILVWAGAAVALVTANFVLQAVT